MAWGVLSGDPIAAASDGVITVATLVGGSPVLNRFQEGGGGWQDWVWPGGAVQSLSLGVVNGIPYLAGRDSSGALWWYTESSGWVGYGQGVFAGGAVAATPR